MIKPIQNSIVPAAAPANRRNAAASGPDFKALFSKEVPQPAAAVKSEAPAQAAAPKAQTAPPAPAGLPPAFTPDSVENHMNNWLMGILRHQNEMRMQAYQNALDGWKNTNARNRELGLPEVAPPQAPEMAEIAPMPAGWWFKTTS